MGDKILTVDDSGNCAKKKLAAYPDVSSTNGSVTVQSATDAVTGKTTYDLTVPAAAAASKPTTVDSPDGSATITEGVGANGGKLFHVAVPAVAASKPTTVDSPDGSVSVTEGVGANGGKLFHVAVSPSTSADYRPKYLDDTNKLLEVFNHAGNAGTVASGATWTTGVQTASLNAGANPEGYTHVQVRVFMSDNIDDGDALITNALARSYVNGVRLNTSTADVTAGGDKFTSENTSANSDLFFVPVAANGDFSFQYEQKLEGGSGTGNVTAWSMLLRAYVVQMVHMK